MAKCPQLIRSHLEWSDGSSPCHKRTSTSNLIFQQKKRRRRRSNKRLMTSPKHIHIKYTEMRPSWRNSLRNEKPIEIIESRMLCLIPENKYCLRVSTIDKSHFIRTICVFNIHTSSVEKGRRLCIFVSTIQSKLKCLNCTGRGDCFVWRLLSLFWPSQFASTAFQWFALRMDATLIIISHLSFTVNTNGT